MTAHLFLDHVAIAVHDLDAAAARFRALGFILTEKGFHVAAPAPGAAPVRTGTGNHCMMLEQGYVELIAITDPAYQGRLRADLARHEGLHLVAFGTESAADASALFQRTTGHAIAPRRVMRPIAERGIPVTAEFDIVDLPEWPQTPGHFFAIQHRTKAALWQPHLLHHANGATGLLGLIACAADPRAYLEPIAAALDRPIADNAIAISERGGALAALDPEAFARRYPGARSPALSSLAAIVLAIGDFGAVQRQLAAQGIPFQGASDRLWVGAEMAHGAIIEFVEMP